MSSKNMRKNTGSGKKTSKQTSSPWFQRGLLLVLIVGLGLLLYPSIADWVNSRNSSRASAQYIEAVEQAPNEKLEDVLKQAREYNETLYLTESGQDGLPSVGNYEEQLKLNDSDVMGTLTIPSIDVSLPIYHGTSEKALMSGIGHLEGSSLPIGGTDTHTVLTGHRGMPSAKLLTRLDELQTGDLFMIRTLGQVLTYQVDSIHIVRPEDVSSLRIRPGEDLATLVTCTPYGVNTHRLLVTGHRVENDLNFYEGQPDASALNPTMVALWIGIPLLGAIVIGLLIFERRKKDSDDSDLEDLDL